MKIKQIAVENFLDSLEGMTRSEAMGNARLDARLYKWNTATQGAIFNGILKAFSGVRPGGRLPSNYAKEAV